MVTQSILDKKMRGGVERLFDDSLAHAEQGPPDHRTFSGERAAEFDQALQDYYGNFLTAKVAGYQKERDSLIEAGSADLAHSRYKLNIDKLKDSFMKGADGGYVDQAKLEQSQQSMMNSLMHFDIPGAIKALVMSIPFVGDFLGAAGKWMMSQFSNNPLSFTEAQEKITLERSLHGALVNVGASEHAKDIKKFVDNNYKAIKGAGSQPAEPATVAPPASAPAPNLGIFSAIPAGVATLDSDFTAPNGATTAPSSSVSSPVRPGEQGR